MSVGSTLLGVPGMLVSSGFFAFSLKHTCRQASMTLRRSGVPRYPPDIIFITDIAWPAV